MGVREDRQEPLLCNTLHHIVPLLLGRVPPDYGDSKKKNARKKKKKSRFPPTTERMLSRRFSPAASARSFSTLGRASSEYGEAKERDRETESHHVNDPCNLSGGRKAYASFIGSFSLLLSKCAVLFFKTCRALFRV